MKTDKEILIEAAELLAERGRAIGKYFSPSQGGCYCMAGAIHKAAGWDFAVKSCGAYSETPGFHLVKALGNRFKGPLGSAHPEHNVFDFNDNNTSEDCQHELLKFADTL